MLRHRLLCFLIVTLALVQGFQSPLKAQTIHSFDDGSVLNDGVYPIGLTLASDGNFYGVTNIGGASGEGAVFKLTPSGTVAILHSFSSVNSTTLGNSDGANPVAAMIQGSDGSLYGTTEVGGSAGNGVVFKITLTGTFTTLHAFGDGSVADDGLFPQSSLVQASDGNFYGTANLGGTAGYGTVFKITSTGTYTTLHNFGDGSVASDGIFPNTALVQGSGVSLYGTTEQGGTASVGMAFQMTPSGAVTVLHNFDDGTVPNDGSYPKAALVQGRDGNFYGSTEEGGAAYEGDVFKMTPAGTVTVLHDFGDGSVANDGYGPQAPLIQGGDGNFYSTTPYSIAEGNGTVYRMTPSGALTVLHTFGDGSVVNDGSEPESGLVAGNSGTFYGVTYLGGSASKGTVFGIAVSGFGPSLTITSLAPASIGAGGPAFPLTINGTNFTNATTVTVGGTFMPVTARSATQLRVTVPASAIIAVGPVTVTATDPTYGSASATLTVTPDWNVQDVAAVSDGTARLLWDRSDGAAGIWSMSASDAQTAVGPTYGPYQGWTAQNITAAPDGTSRVLWNRYDGATGVWVFNPGGVETTIGPTYGPFTGWKAIDLATASDGTSRLLWRYTNGEAGLLSLNAMGSQVISGRSYGPYQGWTATAVGASGDGTARILWTRSDGAMGLWTMDASDLQKTVGPTYGPYSDSHGHWTATDLSTSADGTSCVLWKRSDGAMGVWTFSASNAAVTLGPTYGPSPGWTAAALDAAGDKARVLWVNTNREAGLWSFGISNAETLIGPIYGPF